MSAIARTCLLVLGTAAFLLNPAACAPEDGASQYQFGETELRAAVEGIWLVTVTPPGGTASSFTVRLAQAHGAPSASGVGLVKPAMACGSRTLVRSAAACVDATEMPLTGQVIEGDEVTRSSTVKGLLMVSGLTFGEGRLTVEVGSRKLFGQLSKDGVVTGLSGDLLQGGTATMVRVP